MDAEGGRVGGVCRQWLGALNNIWSPEQLVMETRTDQPVPEIWMQSCVELLGAELWMWMCPEELVAETCTLSCPAQPVAGLGTQLCAEHLLVES